MSVEMEDLGDNGDQITIAISDNCDEQLEDSDLSSSLQSGFNYINCSSKPNLRNVTYLANPILDNLTCPICQQVFQTPLTTTCGHNYCKECILESLNINKTCPLDRTPLDPSNVNDLFPTPLLIANLIDDLKVHCLNKERGCEWEGKKWNLSSHLIHNCDYTGVVCDGELEDGLKCKKVIERRFQEPSLCVHQSIECELCTMEILRQNKKSHLEQQCDENFKQCSGCLNDIVVKNYEKHTEICDSIHVRCEASSIGCEWVGNKDTLATHISGCVFNKLAPTFSMYDSKINTLQEENVLLQKQMSQILNSVIQGKVTNLGYSQELEEIHSDSEVKNQLIYLTFEFERLRYELVDFIKKNDMRNFNDLVNNLINENHMFKDELSLQRNFISSLRNQLKMMLMKSSMPSGTLSTSFNEGETKLNIKL